MNIIKDKDNKIFQNLIYINLINVIIWFKTRIKRAIISLKDKYNQIMIIINMFKNIWIKINW